jgi:hypothetical protein
MAVDTNPFADFSRMYAQGLELNLRASKIIQSGWERALKEYLSLMESSFRQLEPLSKGEMPKDPAAAQQALIGAEGEAIARATQNLQKIQQESMQELGALMQESLETFSRMSPFMRMPPSAGQ